MSSLSPPLPAPSRNRDPAPAPAGAPPLAPAPQAPEGLGCVVWGFGSRPWPGLGRWALFLKRRRSWVVLSGASTPGPGRGWAAGPCSSSAGGAGLQTRERLD
ncbi:hypothetical protein SSPO_025490 [Streptomyces antimycoticus]|uniref:Uncharacterized protein n=1 Tax=Streptomyces antimycoticus TaxID=68175 RepID=A0A499URH6_9ACTN|nr:hypothetical protein SSPO_025490 [Streptomyces antimycoticus]